MDRIMCPETPGICPRINGFPELIDSLVANWGMIVKARQAFPVGTCADTGLMVY